MPPASTGTVLDFKVSSVTKGGDALGDVVVQLEADGAEGVGRGVATDVVEASARGVPRARSTRSCGCASGPTGARSPTSVPDLRVETSTTPGCSRSRNGPARSRREPVASAFVSLASAEPLIRGTNITKRFGSFVAVDGIDFHVEPGEAFGFLGPNGAGKTSTMRMIGCVSTPTSGELRILGMDPAVDGPAIRARLGVVPQEDSLDTELTVLDNLLIYGRYFDLPAARDPSPERGAARVHAAHRAAQRPRRPAVRRHEATAHHRARARSTSPTCCCSTSRPPGSTRRRATSCGTASTN